MASIVQVPSAVVTLLEPPYCTQYRIVVSSNSVANPFTVDQIFSMQMGTFCETVINSRQPLLVADALAQDEWASAPEIGVGMVSYLGYPIFWPDGRVFGTICALDDKANPYSDTYQEFLSYCRDVLEGDLQTVERLSIELEDERAHLRELFARVPEAVVMVDRDSRILRMNPEFTRIFGFGAEEALGQRIEDLIVPDGQQETIESQIYRLFQQEQVLEVETVRMQRNGSPVPVSLVYVPVSSRDGGDVGYLIYRDITQTRRLQDEQRRYHEAQLELARASQIATIGQLSAAIAHELNQPLTGIALNSRTCSRFLASDPVDIDSAREVVGRIVRDGNRATEVVARLRALFAKEQFEPELVDLNEATREVIALSQGELQQHHVILRDELAEDLPQITGDRVQLQQVVQNLVRNAVDAMSVVGDRPRDLLIRTEREDADTVRVSVRDVGIGFDPRAMDALFKPFYSTKSDGMGVGLSVSRSIVERHEGRLWATLNDGPGATFAFSLPCRILPP